MAHGRFSCTICGTRRKFWALTRFRLRSRMNTYSRVHALLCDLDHFELGVRSQHVSQQQRVEPE